ncbi:MAG TPA: ABC transporter ATP-binding protein [Casimicrobiaceae bacterium]|nr:ABC transporter ATP-binding protein [Casimicrobiaceae bacterium]
MTLGRLTLLEARGLTLRAGDRTLCDALDIVVHAGECWAIVGPNGAGKTTLLRTLAGLATPLRGSIRYGDRPLDALSTRERARHRAFLPQDSHDAFPASVLETALVGRHPHVSRFGWESSADIDRVNEALTRFGLGGFAQRDIRTLSGGERRRVALVTLLVQDAPLALLDEPSSHLDIAQQASALEVLVNIACERRHAVMMVLHDFHLALRFCDRAIAIGGGEARAGDIDDIITGESMSKLFRRELIELRDGDYRAFIPR